MFLCLGILNVFCMRTGTTLSQSIWSYFSPVFTSLPKLPRDRSINRVAPTRDLIFIAVVLLVGAGSRAYFLAAPMKWDESRTFDRAYGSFLYGLEYDEPNNHVLNTLLERVSIATFGPNPLAGRLPAYLCGIAAIPLIFIASRAIMPGGCGYFAAAAVGIWPYLILYSANGRGYSLIVLLTVVLILIGSRVIDLPSRGGIALFAIASALGLFTIPSMLFMVAGAFAWIALVLLIRGQSVKQILLIFFLPAGALTIAITAVLYTPVVLVSNGFQDIVDNRWVSPEAWNEFLGQLAPHLRLTMSTLASHLPLPALAVVVILAALGFYSAARRRNWTLFFLLPLTLGVSAALLLCEHRIPFPRTWIFMLPLIFLTADAGFSQILEWSPSGGRSLFIGALYIAIPILPAGFISSYPAQRYSEFPEAPVAAQFLKPILAEGDMIISSATAKDPTFFYLSYGITVWDVHSHAPIKPQLRYYNDRNGRQYTFLWYHQVDNPRDIVRTDPTLQAQHVYYVVQNNDCNLDNSPAVQIYFEPHQYLRIDKPIRMLAYGDMTIYRQDFANK